MSEKSKDLNKKLFSDVMLALPQHKETRRPISTSKAEHRGVKEFLTQSQREAAQRKADEREAFVKALKQSRFDDALSKLKNRSYTSKEFKSYSDDNESRSEKRKVIIKKKPTTPTVESDSDKEENLIDTIPLISKKTSTKNEESSFRVRNRSFHEAIMKVANAKPLTKKRKEDLSERQENFNIFKRVNFLRYRENIFKAAEKVSKDLPPFPAWSYKPFPRKKLSIVKINVSGKIFEVFRKTLLNIPNSKLTQCLLEQTDQKNMYFDRNASCFSYVLNFYRSGRLHAPTNDCMSFFAEELQFWGINENLMEPCCSSEYMAYKNTSETLTRYSTTETKIDNINCSTAESIRNKIYLITTSSDFGILGRWYSIICATAIILAIITMVFSTSVAGRVDKKDGRFTDKMNEESVVEFFGRTNVNPTINLVEVLLLYLFIIDLLVRFSMSPNRLHFFADSINWVDFIATLSSLLAYLTRKKVQAGEYEAYILFMKSTRVFRLFRLTKDLRNGMSALVLTIRSRSSELRLLFILTILMMSMFGAIIYVVELLHETDTHFSYFKSMYDGMWFAIVTMATVGYGDLVPQSFGGYLVGFFCILTGIIISQLPVPIFLKNFASYYSHIQSRQRDVNRILIENIDPENMFYQVFQSGDTISKTIDSITKKE